uniref:Uncharacterized protein n=1 Tax=Thermosporothrix sp. COM3 TaxID=2490863 RepID=A0A455SV62_9CHLR|nr:hypothetical protein KTC_62670 [Thermosporothrix sp. COM3]
MKIQFLENAGTVGAEHGHVLKYWQRRKKSSRYAAIMMRALLKSLKKRVSR